MNELLSNPMQTTCEVDGKSYSFQSIIRKKGKLQCEGCAAFDSRGMSMMPLCDQLPECQGGIWLAATKPRIGSPIITIRLPVDLLSTLDSIAATEHRTRSALILDAIRKRCNTASSNTNQCNTPRKPKGGK